MIHFDYQDNWDHLPDADEYQLTFGEKVWILNENYHRSDGPAIISPNTQTWYRHGKPYRDGELPTSMGSNGDWEFRNEDSRLHRLYYPAFCDGRKNRTSYWWFHNGEDITNNVLLWTKEMGIDPFNLSEDDKVLYLIKFGNRGETE